MVKSTGVCKALLIAALVYGSVKLDKKAKALNLFSPKVSLSITVSPKKVIS